MPELARRDFLLSAASLLGLPANAQTRKPNIVVILSDDQGWGDLSISGNTNLSTPNIDSLARDGALFDRFFVCPVCAPTRAEFLTGRYHPRTGVRGVSEGQERMNLDERTIADTFRASGYATGAFGKWHNGSQFPYHPKARGFDEYYGVTSGHWPNYFNTVMDHNGEFTRGKGYIADDLTDHAIAFIDKHKAAPFFCYIPYNTPHSPMQVPEAYWKKFRDMQPGMRDPDPAREDLGMTRAALAMCENIDWNVGRVLKKLDELKLANDTIVLYFSDNGPASWRWNGGMRGRKGSTDEGGVRSPLLMRWPGHIAPGTRIPQISSATDLLPTLADLAGVSLDSTKPLDGKVLTPLLTSKPTNWPDRMIFTTTNRRVSVRTQRYRLDDQGRLYDMIADPGQTNDVAGTQAEVAATLRKAVADWSEEALPKGPDTRAFPVGESKLTWLPARDGVAAGGIRRSNQYPNSSFFTNWTTKDGEISWDVEVLRAGEFDVAVEYTCPQGSTGAVIEMRFLAAKTSGEVKSGYDPPLLGAENDRVPRIESLYKEFRPLSLGRVSLPAGRGKLTLRATRVPGMMVADVFSVLLTRRV